MVPSFFGATAPAGGEGEGEGEYNGGDGLGDRFIVVVDGEVTLNLGGPAGAGPAGRGEGDRPDAGD